MMAFMMDFMMDFIAKLYAVPHACSYGDSYACLTRPLMVDGNSYVNSYACQQHTHDIKIQKNQAEAWFV